MGEGERARDSRSTRRSVKRRHAHSQRPQRGCGFLIRLRNEAVIHVIEPHTISSEAAAQGVCLDARVELGAQKRRRPWRVVAFQKPGTKQEIIVVTSEPVETLSTLEIVELYRHRWQVELFFRWLKCLVPCRHWLAESQQGVTLQVYLALIEALLLAELTDRKPGRHLMQLYQSHAQGWASGEDVGNIVYNLIETGYFGKNEGDSIEDFAGGFDFETALTAPFRPASQNQAA